MLAHVLDVQAAVGQALHDNSARLGAHVTAGTANQGDKQRQSRQDAQQVGITFTATQNQGVDDTAHQTDEQPRQTGAHLTEHVVVGLDVAPDT